MNDLSPSILFYVSGHGFGHGRRMTQVIAALSSARPDVRIRIRTAAPARVFEPIPPQQIESSPVDSGMIEANALAIDPRATLAHLQQFMGQADSIVEGECQIVRKFRPDLIVADIPFLAGDIAAAEGVPCVGISNFTWDWIYQCLFAGDVRYDPIHRRIVDSYARFDHLLRLPFGQTCAAIAVTEDVPLIAPRTCRAPHEILAQIGVSESDARPRILFATRGGVPIDALVAAATESPEFLFLCVQDVPPVAPANLQALRLQRGLDFSDVLSVCDVVLSKLGYGIVAECIASRVRLVWPRRSGFAEDALTEKDLPKYVPTVEISQQDYQCGQWAGALRAALKKPMPQDLARVDGADQCAVHILNYLVK